LMQSSVLIGRVKNLQKDSDDLEFLQVEVIDDTEIL